MSKPKKIKIAVEFEIPEKVWMDLPFDLKVAGTMATAGIYVLTSSDILAFAVLNAAMNGKKGRKHEPHT